MVVNNITPGLRLRNALTQEKPLQIAGTINAYCAILAKSVGFKAIYLSGGGVAAASHGLPDLGITTLNDVLEDTRRITDICDLPLLVDIDTGWGSFFNIQRAIKSLIEAKAAAVHIEDQVQAKRCGHRPGKAIVSKEEMVDRIKACVDARSDKNFVIMARTDAFANYGLADAIERAEAYVEAGADMIFPEAISELSDYKAFTSALKIPVLANITEFGKTPLYTTEQLVSVGISMVLYPLSAFRAMSAAALDVYQTIKSTGSQQNVVDKMQTREELYHYLHYHNYEQKLDAILSKENE